jgi:hypothetical protein
LERDDSSLSYRLRLQIRLPDGRTCGVEQRIACFEVEKSEGVNLLKLHADNMRKRAEKDMDKQGWADRKNTATPEMYGYGRPDVTYPYFEQTVDFYQLNHKIRGRDYDNQAIIPEPLDELRQGVAKWLQHTQIRQVD